MIRLFGTAMNPHAMERHEERRIDDQIVMVMATPCWIINPMRGTQNCPPLKMLMELYSSKKRFQM